MITRLKCHVYKRQMSYETRNISMWRDNSQSILLYCNGVIIWYEILIANNLFHIRNADSFSQTTHVKDTQRLRSHRTLRCADSAARACNRIGGREFARVVRRGTTEWMRIDSARLRKFSYRLKSDYTRRPADSRLRKLTASTLITKMGPSLRVLFRVHLGFRCYFRKRPNHLRLIQHIPASVTLR